MFQIGRVHVYASMFFISVGKDYRRIPRWAKATRGLNMNEIIAAGALLGAMAGLWLLRRLVRRTDRGRLAWDRFFRPLNWVTEMGKRALRAFCNSRASLRSSAKLMETMLPIPMIVLMLSGSDVHIPGATPISDGWALAWLIGCLVGNVLCKRRLRALDLKEREALVAEIKARSEENKDRH